MSPHSLLPWLAIFQGMQLAALTANNMQCVTPAHHLQHSNLEIALTAVVFMEFVIIDG